MLALTGAGLVGCAPEPVDAGATPGATQQEAEQGAAQKTEQDPAPEAESAQTPAEQGQKKAETKPGKVTALAVESHGDGPIGLQLANAGSLDGAESFSGKLITGPGGCLSLTANERPFTLVFDAATTFGLGDQRPSVADGVLGTVHVGNRVDFTGSRVPLADVTGVPTQCTEGTDFVVVLGK